MGKYLRNLWNLILLLELLTTTDQVTRLRRQLTWPPGGSKTQLILGFGIPVDVPGHNVIMGLVLKYNYRVPTNASEVIEPYVLYQRRSAPTTTRWAVYSALEAMTSRLGLDGHGCVLRAICESSATPVDTDNGLIGQLLHVLLTPSISNEDADMLPERDYHTAERVGKEDAKCRPYVHLCPFSLLGLVTEIVT